jgi:hypothetical protein
MNGIWCPFSKKHLSGGLFQGKKMSETHKGEKSDSNISF